MPRNNLNEAQEKALQEAHFVRLNQPIPVSQIPHQCSKCHGLVEGSRLDLQNHESSCQG